MSELNKQVIVSVGADASGFQQVTDDVRKKLELINNTVSDKSIKTLKQELKDATNATQRLFQEMNKVSEEAEEIGRTLGKNSQQYKDAIANVKTLKTAYESSATAISKLKNDQDELNLSIKNFNPDNKLQSLVSLGRAGIGAIQGVTGAMAFLGVESDDAAKTIAKLQGLMAFSDSLNSLGDLKDSWKNISSLIQSSTVFTKANNAVTAIATTLQRAFGASIVGTGSAFNALKVAIASTGIGLLLVGIAAIVPLIKDWVSSSDSAAIAQRNLSSAIESVNRSLEDNKRMIDFDTKLQEERLKQSGATEEQIRQNRLKGMQAEYEDLVTQGKRLREERNNNAEVSVEENQKANDLILKLSSQASAKYTEILLAQETDKTAIAEKSRADAKTALDKSLAAQKDAGEKSKAQHEAELAEVKKYQQELDAINKAALKAIAERGKNEKDLAIMQNDEEYNLKIAAVQKGIKAEKDLLEKDFKAGRISKEKYATDFLDIEKRSSEASVNLLVESMNKEADIRKKYHELISNFITDQNKTEFEKRKADIIKEYDALILVADAKEKERLEALKSSALGDANTEENLRINTVRSQTNLVISETENVVNDKDSPDTRRKKVEAIKLAEIDAENTAFQLKKEQLKGQQEELALLEAEHAKSLVDINKQASDEKKAIDQAERDAKLANAQAVGQAIGSISALVGEATVVGKALAVADASISAYVGFNKALAQGGLAGIATGALVLATGIMNVKKILSTKIPSVKGAKGDTASAPNLNATAPIIQASATQSGNQVQDVRVTNPENRPVIAVISPRELKNNEDRTNFQDSLQGF